MPEFVVNRGGGQIAAKLEVDGSGNLCLDMGDYTILYVSSTTGKLVICGSVFGVDLPGIDIKDGRIVVEEYGG